MKVKIGELTKIRTGKLDANAASLDGEYPFFTCSKEPLRISTYAYDCECVLVAGNGDLNVKYYNGKFNAYQRTYIIEDNGSGKLYMPYLYYYMCMYVEELRKQAIGGVIKYIKLENLTNALIEIPELEKQKVIVEKLSKLKGIIDNKKYQMAKIDGLVKARFVELFGDPISNSFGLNTKPMTDICEIIDGDRGKNYPTIDDFSDDGYCLFLNAKNVTSDGFNFENCLYITKERDEALRKGRLKRGDVVLTTRGTIGNLAFYTNEIPFEHVRINSGMVILRMKQEVADEVYFIEHFKMQLADIKAKIASGSAQPQLPISTMNKIQILIPEIEQQRDFAAFVEQVDKSKFDKHDNIFTRDKTYEKTTTNPN